MNAQADALVQRGRQLQRSGAAEQALAVYWEALRLAPDHAEAAHLAGLALIAVGRLDMALVQLERAAQLAPRAAAVHHNLGRARLLAGDTAAALRSFGAALGCDPSHLQAGMQRAGVLEGLGRADEAAAAFLVVARAQPQHALAHVGAARQLYRLDRLDEAMACQARAAALEPALLLDGRIGWARAGAGPRPAVSNPESAAALCTAAPGVDALAAVREREVIVVDDVLPDPHAARAAALALPFRHSSADAGVNYPGRQTDGGHDDPALMQRITDLVGRDLKWGWPGHGAYRCSPAGSLARSDIHADHDDARPAYAGVLCLSLPEHCRGGTSFWRHHETGWARVPTPAEAAATPYRDYGAFLAAQRQAAAAGFESLAAARRDWDLVIELPLRFNRLVVYRADYFHAVSEVFGTDAADSRLVQLFFFEPVGEAARACG